ncbi:hypothetical protein OIDMADRAFT_169530 [Oidiodendron maius Zn]|uniref:Uncharacterized protein n=1 Tax=Oidiodendron maius (strain Zn) TaxID=913774 RepID=A0A0C3H2H6_OIDMZ|nr:hypothetical protein OIDMADRAFT_169530 [Oidiodendron maius Zn]
MEDKGGLKFKQEIQQMMFVSGEMAEPSIEVLKVMEEIVRDQVVEMLAIANGLASRRASRFITNNDIIFQFRHDALKVSRIRSFLAWKDFRKNAKDEDKDAAGDPTISDNEDDIANKVKKEIQPLPWDIGSFYNQTVPADLKEEEEEMDRANFYRLQREDERTKNMTKDEYITWSEYRQASFTRRKVKRFREWAGIGVITECKDNEDVMDILGFLICDMVHGITEEALRVKEQNNILMNGMDNGDLGSRKLGKNDVRGLFDRTTEERIAFQPKHIRQALVNLQGKARKGRAIFSGARAQQKMPLQLVSVLQT